MTDFWSFLLQTPTATSAAVLVLAAKAMFQDKLPPRWQFASWGLVGLALLLPAGISGRYALINWPFWIEAAKSSLTGEYGTLTRVIAPVPLPFFRQEPFSLFDWLYVIYVTGVIVCLARYILSYLQLRLALKKIGAAFGHNAGEKEENRGITAQSRVDAAAARFGLPSCRVVEVEELPTAFVCGVLRPVLVLPANRDVDEKVILHELLHLKHHDVLWGIFICLLRCVHWCNPLLWACADMAGNDLEARCDQRVLERLSGEERRDYGHILLSMADGKYAKTPGTSSVANGSRNIRRRIRAIARFKKYPKGMGLVSTCILLILSLPFAVGTKPEIVSGKGSLFFDNTTSDMTRARLTVCTTFAGAFDIYAKALLSGSIPYRVMCAPLAEHDALAAEYLAGTKFGSYGEALLPARVNVSAGYSVYNLAEVEKDVYEGLLVLQLSEPPKAPAIKNTSSNGAQPVWFAVQYVRAEKQDGRFVVLPQEDFRAVQGDDAWDTIWPNSGVFPGWCYEGKAGDFMLRLKWQTAACVENESQNLWGSSASDTEPQPDGIFTIYSSSWLYATYVGKPEDKSRYTKIAHSGYLVWEGEEKQRQQMSSSASNSFNSLSVESCGSSSDGSSWSSRLLREGWEDKIFLDGSGTMGSKISPPACYVMKLYLNGKLEAELTLELVEGGLLDE